MYNDNINDMNNPKNNITSAGTLASIVVALLMVVLAGFSCSESDTEPEADTTTVRITATLPAANVTGQTRADASIADPVPADAYPEFSLSYTKVDTDSEVATAAAKGNAVAWAADGNSVTLDFSPLEWKTMKRDGSTPATVSAAGTQPDTRVSSPKRDFVSGFFTVAAGAFAPTVAPALVHQTARVAIVLKSNKADKVLVAADYTATMDITTGSTAAAVPLTFTKGADTKADGAAIGTPYALLYLSAAELSIAEGSKLIISKADGTELASITLRDLNVTVAGGATTKLSTFVKGQYLTITVTLNERLELTGNPTVTVTSWTVGDEWTLNAN